MSDPPKRNSGRTGRRRLTPAELAMRDRKARTDAVRRYGPSVLALPIVASLGEPPSWFSVELRAIWYGTINQAPPGLLQPIDAANLTVFCVALDQFHRLAQTAAPGDAALRLAGAEVGRAAKALSFPPVERQRFDSPPPAASAPEAEDRWAELRHFPVIDGGKVRKVKT